MWREKKLLVEIYFFWVSKRVSSSFSICVHGVVKGMVFCFTGSGSWIILVRWRWVCSPQLKKLWILLLLFLYILQYASSSQGLSGNLEGGQSASRSCLHIHSFSCFSSFSTVFWFTKWQLLIWDMSFCTKFCFLLYICFCTSLNSHKLP